MYEKNYAPDGTNKYARPAARRPEYKASNKPDYYESRIKMLPSAVEVLVKSPRPKGVKNPFVPTRGATNRPNAAGLENPKSSAPDSLPEYRSARKKERNADTWNLKPRESGYGAAIPDREETAAYRSARKPENTGAYGSARAAGDSGSDIIGTKRIRISNGVRYIDRETGAHAAAVLKSTRLQRKAERKNQKRSLIWFAVSSVVIVIIVSVLLLAPPAKKTPNPSADSGMMAAALITPFPDPSPSETAAVFPADSAGPDQSADEPAPSESVGATVTPAPSATVKTSPTPQPTATPRATPKPTPKPTATPAPTATQTASPSPQPTQTASPTPQPTETPTETQTETQAPEPESVPSE